MKVAFHFDADDESFGGYYGHPIRQVVFGAILTSRKLDLHTKVFEGDFLLSMFCIDKKITSNGELLYPNQKRYFSALEVLFNPDTHIWKSMHGRFEDKFRQNRIHVCAFESIRFRDAIEIDKLLTSVAGFDFEPKLTQNLVFESFLLFRFEL